MEIIIGLVIIVGIAVVLIRGQNKKEAGFEVEQAPSNPGTTVEVAPVLAPIAEAAPVEEKKARKPRATAKTAPAKKPAAKKVPAKKPAARSKKA